MPLLVHDGRRRRLFFPNPAVFYSTHDEAPCLRPRRDGPWRTSATTAVIPVVPPRCVHALTPSIGMALMAAGISRALGVGGRWGRL